VGLNNLSDDLAMLDTYVTPMAQSQHHMGPTTVSLRRESGLMLGSTEEVQAIVKTCNKHKIKFKAPARSGHPGVIFG
jgi:hypothetical protein